MSGSTASLRGTAVRATAFRATTAVRQPMSVAALTVGDKAPVFTLKDQNGKEVSLKKFQGLLGKPVVLYFYPKDNSPGCTKEAKAFKDSYAAFKKIGAEVIGVSSDSAESHKEFKQSLDLPFTLLADEAGEVRQLYEVPKDLFGLLDGRQTFVIGKDGAIKLIFNDQFGPEKHVEQALAALEAKVTTKA